MWVGPIHSVMPGSGTGYSPVKPIRVQSSTGKSAILFGSTSPYALTAEVQSINFDHVFLEQDMPTVLVRMHQLEELSLNTEWQRCGLYIKWQDTQTDGEDGWGVLPQVDMSEEFIYSAYAEPHITVEMRAKDTGSIGVFADQKLQPNDAGLGGLSLVAFPQGVGSQKFPAVTWSFAASDGSTISVVEAPVSNLRASLVTPTDTMTLGRCSVMDQVS